MKKLILITFLISGVAQADSAVVSTGSCDSTGAMNVIAMIGPSISYKFGNEDRGGEWSAGIEASGWSSISSGSDGCPKPSPLWIGADLGMEWNFQQSSFSIYSEFQGSLSLVGAGIGPVFNTKSGLGWQSSVWANVIGGAWYRKQNFEESYDSIGVYAKGPIFWSN